MENKQDIGKAFRERLNGLNREPGDAVWEGINASLQQNKRGGFKVPLWGRATAIVLGVILMAVLTHPLYENYIPEIIIKMPGDKQQTSTGNGSNSTLPSVTVTKTDAATDSQNSTNATATPRSQDDAVVTNTDNAAGPSSSSSSANNNNFDNAASTANSAGNNAANNTSRNNTTDNTTGTTTVYNTKAAATNKNSGTANTVISGGNKTPGQSLGKNTVDKNTATTVAASNKTKGATAKGAVNNGASATAPKTTLTPKAANTVAQSNNTSNNTAAQVSNTTKGTTTAGKNAIANAAPAAKGGAANTLVPATANAVTTATGTPQAVAANTNTAATATGTAAGTTTTGKTSTSSSAGTSTANSTAKAAIASANAKQAGNVRYSSGNFPTITKAIADSLILVQKALDYKESKERVFANTAFTPLQDTLDGGDGYQNDFYVFAFVAPSNYKFGESTSLIDPSLNNQGSSAETSTNFGAYVGYEFSSQLTVRAGVISAKITQNTGNVTLGADYIGVDYANGMSNTAANVALGGSPVTLRQKTSFIEVPVEATYALFGTRADLYFKGGFSGLFLQDNELHAQNSQGSLLLGSLNTVKDFSISGNAGFGFYYKFTRELQLNVEPGVKYYFNSFDNVNPWSLSVQAGLLYRF